MSAPRAGPFGLIGGVGRGEENFQNVLCILSRGSAGAPRLPPWLSLALSGLINLSLEAAAFGAKTRGKVREICAAKEFHFFSANSPHIRLRYIQ